MSLNTLTLYDLRSECERLDLDNSGNKADLVKRLSRVASGELFANQQPLNSTRTPGRKSRARSKTPSQSKSPAAKSRSKTPSKKTSKSSAVKKSPKRSSTPKRSASKGRKSSKKSSGDVDMTGNRALFWWEEDTKSKKAGVLSDAGATNIANHKYKSGGYTWLDNKLNPFWEFCVGCLPMSLAPNMVTTLGCFMLVANFFLVWHFDPHFDQPIPKWVFFVNGFFEFWYYTFDCMDGKQARRTGASSPLGQLFDHGCDCLGNISHFSVVSAILLPGANKLTLAGQLTLQFSFFCAQWQEYHTRELPHCVGNFGVTEMAHLTALFCATFSLVDNVAIFGDIVVMGDPLGVFVVKGWILLQICLVFASFKMTIFGKPNAIGKLLHLLSPFSAVAIAMIIPNRIVAAEIRYISVAFGILFSFLTNKMIVYSMAKMSFAGIQKDIFPLLVVSLVLRYGNLEDAENHNLVVAAVIWQVLRLCWWSKKAIDQLCEKLNINCFTIKSKDE